MRTLSRQATGYPIGGVPPFGHATPLPVFVDPDLLAYDEVWAAAGTWHDVFGIEPSRLVDGERRHRSRPQAVTALSLWWNREALRAGGEGRRDRRRSSIVVERADDGAGLDVDQLTRHAQLAADSLTSRARQASGLNNGVGAS